MIPKSDLLFLQCFHTRFTQSYYQSLLLDIATIPEESTARIKAQLRSTCEKYYKVKILFRYRQKIKRLSNNKDIVILQQDKGRVVILNRSKYIEKLRIATGLAVLIFELNILLIRT